MKVYYVGKQVTIHYYVCGRVTCMEHMRQI
jgi:hypothetical protein